MSTPKIKPVLYKSKTYKDGSHPFMGEEQAHFLHNNYQYLVNQCVLLPGIEYTMI